MRMRKPLIIVILTVAIIITSTVSSLALPQKSSVQEKAELLEKLKILTGSNGDFRFNDKLSRSEAATFAVRILGKEIHVLVNSSTYKKTNYPDVDANAWYAPYVGYCTKEGILSGDAKGNFNPNDYITEKSFLKIILGVLEYEMNKDYTWDSVYKKAYEVGLVKDLSYIMKTDDNTEFKRADAVSILYNALTLKTSKSKREVFYNLIDSGIITESDAVKIGFIEEIDEEESKKEEEEVDKIITKIEEIKVLDETTISIHFNEEIKKIDKIVIYEYFNAKKLLGLQIETIDDNYIIVKTDKQTPGIEYEIKITGVEDMNGYVQDELYTSFMSFTPDSINSNFFRLKKVEPVNEKSVLLYFTHPININIENTLYYKVYEGNNIFADGEDNELLARIYKASENSVMLSLKNNSFTEGDEYTIEIDGRITSAYGVELNDGEGERIGFKAKPGKQERFKLDQIIPYDESTVMLIFNKEINPFLAQQIYNFYITDENGNPISIQKATTESTYETSGEVLFVSINGKFKRNKLYYITINNLNDITRQEYIQEVTYSFEADYDDKEELEITNIEAINNQVIEVYFSLPLDEESAHDVNNYTIKAAKSSSKIYPKAAYYDRTEDPYKVVLYFSDEDKLVGNRDYELQINKKFKDYMGNITTDYLKEDFTAVAKAKRNLSIKEVVPISSSAIKLVFDEAIAFDRTNLSAENYLLEYNLNGMSITEVPLSVLYYNSKTIILKFSEMHYDMPYSIKFNSIKDYFGTTYRVTADGTNYVEFELAEELR